MEDVLLILLGLMLSFVLYVLVVWMVTPHDPPAKWDEPVGDDRHLA